MLFLFTAGALFITSNGPLEPQIHVDGQPVACKVTALADGVVVECPHSEGPLTAFVKPAARIDLTSARVRVEARRNGVLLPADVRFFRSGALDGPPLFELAANQSKVVAAGKYDVLVVLKDRASPEAETLLAGVRIAGPKITVFSADLSDGTLLVDASNNGRSASASVRAFRHGTQKEIGVVESGQELRLPSGRYRINTELREASDFAAVDREIWIRANQTARLKERFTTGQLSVTVVKDAKPVDATVRLSRPSAADFFNYFPAPGTVSLTPGAYDLTIESSAAGPLGRVREENVAVRAGTHTRRTIDLTPATLLVRTLKNGGPADARITVRTAGGGEAFEPAADGRYRLWPGRYEIEARLEDGTEQIEGPFAVKLRDQLTRVVRFERAYLTVRAQRGKAVAADAEILVYKSGASKPVARGKSGAKLELPPGVYDVKVVAGTDVVWKKDVRVKTTQFVDLGLPPKSDAADDLPEGDLPPPSDDLPEGDAEG